MKETVTMSIVVEDPVEAAESFASARKVERAVKEMDHDGPLVFTNFTGSFTTLPPQQRVASDRMGRRRASRHR